MTLPVTPEVLENTYQVYLESGENLSETARRLGLTRSAVRERMARRQAAGRTAPPAPLSPVELRDASFWRARCARVQKELAEAQHLVAQLAGACRVPVTPPEWVRKEGGSRGRSVVGALVSDMHMGEVIAPAEVGGVNAFDVDICKRRMNRYFQAVCEVGSRWASDTACEGVLLALAGDLVSGDIHEELRATNEVTSLEQVRAAVETISAGVRLLLTVYPRVHVVGVPGNHGRTTLKPTAKLYARLSYDTLIVSFVADQFAGDSRVTFQSGDATDQTTPVFGRLVFTTHGDKIGTRGGMGFVGPMLPIVRGAKKIVEQQVAFGQRPDLILCGHYHVTGNPAGVLANGSVPGYSEYANDIRAAIEPPQQWLFLLHSKWWLRERAPIQLEDPAVTKIRVRVPAAIAR